MIKFNQVLGAIVCILAIASSMVVPRAHAASVFPPAHIASQATFAAPDATPLHVARYLFPPRHVSPVAVFATGDFTYTSFRGPYYRPATTRRQVITIVDIGWNSAAQVN